MPRARAVIMLLLGIIGGAIMSERIPSKDAGFEQMLLSSTESIQAEYAQIPKIVHFIFGLKGDAPPFEIEHYLAIKSAYVTIKPEIIYFWYHYEPVSELWKAVKPMVVMKRTDMITSVYGNKIVHFAHMADVVRLMILHEFGGIYLDIDVVSLKPFDHLLNNEMEGNGNGIGLCNAVILSKPRGAFLRKWMESYKSFDGLVWNYHSVQLPGKLAKEFPDQILMLNYEAFFWPLWNSNGMQSMFMQKDYNYTNNYAVHLWETNAKEWFLSKTSISVINEIDNSLFCEVRRFVRDDPFDKSLDENCKIRKSSMYNDGTAGVYTFDDDSEIKIIDYLGNHLHGWALNGTRLRSEINVSGVFREFNGQGDFVVLPTMESLTLAEITVSFRFKTPRACKHRRVILSLQHPSDYSVVIETDCTFRGKFGEVLELRAIVTNTRAGITSYNLESAPVILNNGRWHDAALTLSASAGKMILYIDGDAVGDSEWPMKSNIRQQIKNVWLGTKPPPSIRTMKRPLNSDFKGYIDNLVISQVALKREAIQSIRKDLVSHFASHRQNSLSKHHFSIRDGMSIVRYDFTTKHPLLDLTGNGFEAILEASGDSFNNGLLLSRTARLVMPLFQPNINILPEVFTIAAIVAITTNSKENDDVLFIYWATFTYGGQIIGIGYEARSGAIQVKNINQKWLDINIRAPRDGPCLMQRDLFLYIEVTMDWQQSRITITCNGYKLLQAPSPMGFVRKITDISIGGIGNFMVKSFDIYAGDHEKPEIAYGKAAEILKAPGFLMEFKGKVIYHRSPGHLSDNLAALVLESFPNMQNSIVINLENNGFLTRICPRITSNELLVFPKIIMSGKSTSIYFEYRCLSLGSHTVTVNIPDLWTSVEWMYQCNDVYSPSDMMKLVDEFISYKHIEIAPKDEHEWDRDQDEIGLIAAQNQSTDSRFKLLSLLSIFAFLATFSLLRRSVIVRKGYKSKSRAFWIVSIFICGTFYLIQTSSSLAPASVNSRVIQLQQLTTRSLNNSKASSSDISAQVARLNYIYERDSMMSNNFPTPALFAANTPFISIITPCYNQTQYLSDTSLSILQQSYLYWEWIIIRDGGSEDCYIEAKKIQSENPGKSIRVFDKPNSGLADTRNFGIENAFGDWICLLDADDTIHYSYLEEVAATITAKPHVTAINSNQQFFQESEWKWDLPAFSSERIKYVGLFPVQTVFRKWDWARVNGFEPTLPWGNEDWSFWISLSHLLDFKVRKVPGYLLKYRYKKNSMQREKELYEVEVNALLMTLHPEKYSAVEIIQSHSIIMQTRNKNTVNAIVKFAAKFPTRKAPYLWLGMYAEEDRLYDLAVKYYDRCIGMYERGLDWQPLYRKIMISAHITAKESKLKELMQLVLKIKPDLRQDDQFDEYFRKFVN